MGAKSGPHREKKLSALEVTRLSEPGLYDACMGGAVEFDRNAQDCLRIARSMSLGQLKEADEKKHGLVDDLIQTMISRSTPFAICR